MLVELLFAATPPLLRWSSLRLHNLLDLFPLRSSMPRVTLGKDLVISCAQWRIATATLWDSGSSEPGKARELESVSDSISKTAQGLEKAIHG